MLLLEKDANGIPVSRRTFTEQEYCLDCKAEIPTIQPLLMVVEWKSEDVAMYVRYCPICRREEVDGTVPEQEDCPKGD